ncbi:hypothetical protein [Nocardioides sp.]|uniref:hypothetical protein n=1 Tax=Nocardioides sp. TaxID=35761 RepID=UPI003561536B
MTLPIGVTASAVDALRECIRAALPLPDAVGGVTVFDGPAPERAYAPRAVTVAAAFEDDQDAVLVERVESGARPNVTETLTVAGSVYAGGGDVNVDHFRDEVGTILTAIDAALKADRTLGGVVHLARLASAQWLQGRDAKGTGVRIGFTIQLVSLS